MFKIHVKPASQNSITEIPGYALGTLRRFKNDLAVKLGQQVQ